MYGLYDGLTFYNCDAAGTLTSGAVDKTTITHLFIAADVPSLPYELMENCTALEAVELKGASVEVGAYAFQGCAALRTFTGAVNAVWQYAFYGCANLEALELTADVTTLWTAAFNGCAFLASLTGYTAFSRVEAGAFNGCGNLTEVRLTDNAAVGNHAFTGCASLTNISGSIGSWLDSTGGNYGFNVFEGCTSLTALPTITADFIPRAAFQNCGLTSAVIPDTITRIDAIAFAGNGSLARVLFQGNAPTGYRADGVFPTGVTMFYSAGKTGFTNPADRPYVKPTAATLNAYGDVVMGDMRDASIDVTPAGGTLLFTSSNTIAATVDAYTGKLTAKAVGETVITAYDPFGSLTSTQRLVVAPINPTKVTATPAELDVKAGESGTFTLAREPENAIYPFFDVEFSDGGDYLPGDQYNVATSGKFIADVSPYRRAGDVVTIKFYADDVDKTVIGQAKVNVKANPDFPFEKPKEGPSTLKRGQNGVWVFDRDYLDAVSVVLNGKELEWKDASADGAKLYLGEKLAGEIGPGSTKVTLYADFIATLPGGVQSLGVVWLADDSDLIYGLAEFQVQGYTINAKAGANGSISPAGQVEVAAGADQTFEFKPNTNYIIDTLKVDGVAVDLKTIKDSKYTFAAVAADHTIEVAFKAALTPVTGDGALPWLWAAAGVAALAIGLLCLRTARHAMRPGKRL